MSPSRPDRFQRIGLAGDDPALATPGIQLNLVAAGGREHQIGDDGFAPIAKDLDRTGIDQNLQSNSSVFVGFERSRMPAGEGGMKVDDSGLAADYCRSELPGRQELTVRWPAHPFDRCPGEVGGPGRPDAED